MKRMDMQDENKTRAMFGIVEQWQQSGKSQNQFCAENGIRLHTLGYWVKRYRQSQAGHEGFASVSIGGEAERNPATPRIEVELPGGLVVRIY
jgi:transposase-like protein